MHFNFCLLVCAEEPEYGHKRIYVLVPNGMRRDNNKRARMVLLDMTQ